MTKETGQLKDVYTIENTEHARDFYDGWADTYDAEIAANGYVTPRRCAEALAKFATDKSAPVLDVGCGTGLSGVALKAAGFANIDGCDLSPEMLQRAGKRKGVYRKLWEADIAHPFPFAPGTYTHIAAMGVIASSHAPPSTIDDVLAALPSDGMFVFSLNDVTLQDPEFEARIAENVDAGMARLIFKEHGEHLPTIDLKSVVYILQKI